jgi:penicillin-binding protein 2
MRNPFEVYTNLNKDRGRRDLDWEESALDSHKQVEEGFFDEERQAPKIAWVFMLLLVSFAILAARLFSLQIIGGASYRTLSENNRIRSQIVLAPRGVIKDRYNQVLAQNMAGFNLVAVPFDLPKQGVSQEIEELAKTFALNSQDIQTKINAAQPSSFDPVVIAQDLTQEQNILFQTKANDFYGFQVQQIPIRQYLNPQIFSNVLGYTGLISSGDLNNLDKDVYATNDFIGKTGVEAQYEKYLHGTNGQNMVEVDATGKVLNVLGENSPLPGDTLVLNIDEGLQERLYHSLADNNPNRKAAAIAIDPRNGQVLALVSIPGFDNNLFAQGISQKDYLALTSDKNLPLFNRAISGTYPPGSTVKPMAATAGLETGVINENTEVNDRGVLNIPNQFNPALSYAFHGWKPGGLGVLKVRQAIALSSDIFFYEVAGGYPNSQIPEGLGAQRLADWYRKFNVGSKTGIDIPGEVAGLVPDPAWKAKYYKDDPILSKWYLGDTYHIGIGQGDLLVTPLQVAEWTATIANGGTSYVPQIVNKAVDSSGKIVMQNTPKVLVSNIASSQTIKIVQEGMRETVTAGTAKPLMSLPITSAGKTGTSQFDGSDPNRTHAWFTAYAPYETPEIVITVLVEAGGEGNAVSEPVVKDVLSWWAQNRYNKTQ